MPELVTNLHIHSRYSDGFATHAEIARYGLDAGLDVVIITDHNIYVQGFEGYHFKGGNKLLMLVGEEVHDRMRDPQKNHLLVIGADKEMTPFAGNPQALIDNAGKSGGVTFLAHPVDPALPIFNETDISWEDWDIRGYTGLELWNNFSEMKFHVHSRLEGFYRVLFPEQIAHQPPKATLALWDSLLASGRKVVAIGGSDAHAIPMHLGPIKRIVLPYLYHFHAINTHLIVPHVLSGDLPEDRRMIINALRQGNAFIGYDLPAPTRGFIFTAHGEAGLAQMGEEMNVQNGVTFQIHCPDRCEIHLLRDGKTTKRWQNHDTAVFSTSEPGIYRVECYISFMGARRGWIFSNPISILRKKRSGVE